MENVVDVVIPVYNHSAAFKRALASVLAQTLDSWNCFAVDDGSSEADAEVIASACKMDRRVHYIRRPNAGPGTARNVGAREGRAEFLAFLDADDHWDPEYLATLVDLLRSSDSAAFAACRWRGRPWTGEARLSGLMTMPATSAWERMPELKRWLDSCHSSAVVLRRSAFARSPGYHPTARFGEDTFLFMSLLLRFPALWYADKLVTFTSDHSALTMGIGMRVPVPAMLRDNDALIRDAPCDRRSQVRAYIGWYRGYYIRQAARLGQFAEVRGAMQSASGWREYYSGLSRLALGLRDRCVQR